MDVHSSLRLVFAGTPEFAVPSLLALLANNIRPIVVYTQPDRPHGRGQKIAKSPVKLIAETHQLPIEQPIHFKNEADILTLQNYAPDILVVVAYGLILPESVLKIPRLGCINLHPSLLPKYRGALPMPQAILEGDEITGVTVMQLEMGLDSGPILAQEHAKILPTDTSETLSKRLADQGAQLLVKTIQGIITKSIQPIPQDHSQATYTRKLTKESAHIHWIQPASVIERAIRAMIPWPVTFYYHQDVPIRIWGAKLESSCVTGQHAVPGTIVACNPQGLLVATGEGFLRLTTLQLPSKKPMPFDVILRGHPHLFQIGELLT